MFTFVLMEPKTAGNVGAVARVLKNFGFSQLMIIDPACDAKGKEAQDRAKHAQDVLKKAVIASPSVLSSFDTVIATTSKLGSDYNLPRSPLTPDQLVSVLPASAWSPGKLPHIAVVLGREGDGLSNEEILASDVVLAIPSDPKYPALNVSHAAAVIAYELSRHRHSVKVCSHIAPALAREQQQMVRMINSVIDSLHFATREKKETQRRVWKRLFAKAFLSRREAFAVMGLLRKLLGLTQR